jgi:hypothetical protein
MYTAFQIQFDKLADMIEKAIEVEWESLSPIEAWRIRHFAKIAKMFDSFSMMMTKTRDYVSACAIIRMIYDNWYSYLWIYEFSDGDDVLLRYYLYVLDSIKQREKTILLMHEDNPVDPQLKSLLAHATADCEEAKRQFCTAIKKLPVYRDYHANIKKAWQSNNSWRYKDIKATNLEYYNWSGLYERISSKETRAFLSYLSQYVHGLYASSLTIVPTEAEMLYVLGEAQSLIMSINLYLADNPLR